LVSSLEAASELEKVRKQVRAYPNKVLLGSDQFLHAGKEYLYSQVTSLAYYAVKTTRKINFATCRVTYNAEIVIYVQGLDQPIKIRPEKSIPVSIGVSLLPYRYEEKYTREKADSVSQLYVQLAEKTFPYRIKRYLQMVEQYGCFLYDGKRFFPDGLVIGDDYEVNFRAATVYKRPFEVFVSLPKSLGKELIHRFIKDQDFVISTKYDADVFFALLEKLYGKRWKE
jgi:hypothetical protein